LDPRLWKEPDRFDPARYFECADGAEIDEAKKCKQIGLPSALRYYDPSR
jgi:cytochrome P450